jgi:hypothetical protein
MRAGELVRCDKCSYDNPADYRFCGMCGATLADPVEMQAPEIKRAAVSRDRFATKIVPTIRDERVSSPLREERYIPPISEERPPAEYTEREYRERPAAPISGPSFLGLGSEPPSGGTYESYSPTPDYLLEDEEPKRSYGRFVFILVLLAVIGGLAWMRYTRGDWIPPWVKTALQSTRKPPQQQAEATPPAADNSAAPATPDNAPAGTATEIDIPAAGGSNSNASGPAAGSANTQGAQPTQSATNTPTADSAKTPATKEPESAKPAEANANNSGDEDAAATPPAAAKAPSKKAVAENNEDADEPPAKTRATKPTKAARPVEETNPDDALVANAEKYLYGRGVPQNCDRALSALRAAAGRSNSRARILLGTMYATGHCVGRDLPNAYRWFALASRENADNVWVQRNLEMIWREMTPQERQLATQRSQ